MPKLNSDSSKLIMGNNCTRETSSLGEAYTDVYSDQSKKPHGQLPPLTQCDKRQAQLLRSK